MNEILITIVISVVTTLGVWLLMYLTFAGKEESLYRQITNLESNINMIRRWTADEIKELKGLIMGFLTSKKDQDKRYYEIIEDRNSMLELIKQLADYQGIKITEVNEFKKYKFEDNRND